MVQTAWSLLMGIYSNSLDIVTGMTLNGRTEVLPGIVGIVGPTITTVPFRATYQADELAIDLLQKIQSQYLEIIPFVQFGLQNIRRLSSDADAACNFRNLLVIQSGNSQPSRLLLGRKHYFSSLDCPLLMECELYDQTIHLQASFDEKLLQSAEISRIFQQLEHILSRLSSCGSSTTVSDLQQICNADTQQLLQWNATSNTPKQSQTLVHDLFEQRQQSQPNAPAVCAWDGGLSYKALDEYSSRLASHLQTHYGIGPESLVTICFEKSMWVVVAMLAVLKAGGACVPTDPKNPKGRLQTIVQSLGNNNANLILTSAVYADRLGAIGSTVLIVNSTMLDLLTSDVYLRNATTTPANSAFIVFTSGSTGNPKGIALEHSALCSSVLAHGSFIQLGTHSRVLQFAAHTFDISIGDIFAT
jgi:non-ribosomal peptide synthetase component F